MKITVNHMFWLYLLVLALVVVTGSNLSIIMNPSFAIFAFIVIFLLMMTKKNGEFNLGMLAINGSLVCISFIVFEAGVFDYLFWSVMLLVVFSIGPVAYHYVEN